MYYYDLHCHSDQSPDSRGKLIDIIKMAKKRRLTGLAITDHNTVYDGLTNVDGVEIIPGSEITLKNGTHLLAFFIRKPLRANYYTLKQAIKLIHGQRGYAVLAHPFRADQGWFDQSPNNLWALKIVDGLEAKNAKNSPIQQRVTERFVSKHIKDSLPFTAGSDAHIVEEVGFAGIMSASLINRTNFLQVLRNSRPIVKTSLADINQLTERKRQTVVRVTKILGIYHFKPFRDLMYKLYIWYNRRKKHSSL